MRRPCILVAQDSDDIFMQILETCPDVGPRGEVVYTAFTQSEIDKLTVAVDLFSFDSVLFGKFTVYFILLFLSGYFAGLIARKLGR